MLLIPGIGSTETRNFKIIKLLVLIKSTEGKRKIYGNDFSVNGSTNTRKRMFPARNKNKKK